MEKAVNVLLASACGVVAGAAVGFILGRRWLECEDDDIFTIDMGDGDGKSCCLASQRRGFGVCEERRETTIGRRCCGLSEEDCDGDISKLCPLDRPRCVGSPEEVTEWLQFDRSDE